MKVDWVGSALLAAGLVPFLIALTWAENPYAWKSKEVIAPLVVGAIFVGMFVLYEWKGRDDGLLHHKVE